MSAKLLVCCHKEGAPSGVTGISTIKVGADIAGRDFACDYSDNVGDNISAKNLTYDEITAIYWAWKNYDAIGNPSHVGFMHYRRFFYFDTRIADSVVRTSCPANVFVDKSGYCEVKLDSVLKMCDFVAARPCRRRSVSAQFAASHGRDMLESMVSALKSKRPEYADICDKYLASKDCYFFNMFIFPKEIFFDYCEFIFPILDEVTKAFPTERLFVSERLTGIYIASLLAQGKKVTYLPVVFRDGNGENRFKRFALEIRSRKGVKGFFYALFHLLCGRRGERRRV